jgi:uncharacterized protein (DUF1684 family)
VSDLDNFRASKDEFFAEDPHSPLTSHQRAAFSGLSYFPENPALRLNLALDTDVDHDYFEMGTSTGDRQDYRRAGRVVFSVEGQECELFLYSQEEGSTVFFVPFRDRTSGAETYPAGRYLEAELGPDGTVEIDFNYAYNPYCAYNEHWSCPLPPMENWLMVPIRAGEMSFHD